MKVAIAVDGSTASQGALALANSYPLAASSVTLIHVTPTLSYEGLSLPEEAQKEINKFNREIEEKSDEIIKNAQAQLSAHTRHLHTYVTSGNPAEQIIHHLDKQQMDMVILGARGINPVQTLFVGSVADTVLRHAHCSVLLFRGQPPAAATSKKLNILLGYDDSLSSRHALEHLSQWDLSQAASVHLVSFAQMSYYYGMTYSMGVLSNWPAHQHTLEESLTAAQGELQQRFPTLKITTDVLTNSHDVSTELNTYAKQHHCDLIVVGSKGKNLLDRIMLGSISNGLAHHADRPVLVVRS